MKPFAFVLSVLTVLMISGVVPSARAEEGVTPAASPLGPGHLVVPAAGVKLPALFSDNMILQSGVKCPLWGAAPPEAP